MIENIEDVKSQLIMLGNAAHDLRNIFAQQNKQQIPEIQAIDQMSGQQEGIARRYAAKLCNPIGPGRYAKGKEVVGNMQRQTNFFLRCLRMDGEDIGYQILHPDMMQRVIDNIHLQQQILAFVDHFIEKAFTLKRAGNKLPLPNDSFKNDLIYKNLDFSKEINIEKCYENPCITNFIDAARQTCNKAHNIQNIICFYIPAEQVKVQAQSINKLAGNLEDSYRSILNSFGQERNNILKIKDVIKSEIRQSEQQCQQIITVSKQLEGAYTNDMRRIQTLCDQILLSIFFFNDVSTLPNISTL